MKTHMYISIYMCVYVVMYMFAIYMYLYIYSIYFNIFCNIHRYYKICLYMNYFDCTAKVVSFLKIKTAYIDSKNIY